MSIMNIFNQDAFSVMRLTDGGVSFELTGAGVAITGGKVTHGHTYFYVVLRSHRLLYPYFYVVVLPSLAGLSAIPQIVMRLER